MLEKKIEICREREREREICLIGKVTSRRSNVANSVSKRKIAMALLV
jgi:hypothetical protein